MWIVELFLPLERSSKPFLEPEVIERIVTDLANQFGGATAFTRSPAEGLWKQQFTIQKDRIIIVEVMVNEIDEAWWRRYRRSLESQFAQDEILIRVTPCRRL